MTTNDEATSALERMVEALNEVLPKTLRALRRGKVQGYLVVGDDGNAIIIDYTRRDIGITNAYAEYVGAKVYTTRREDKPS